MRHIVGNNKTVILDYNNEMLKVEGNNCIVKVATNHGDIEVFGNNCVVEIGNHGRFSMVGGNDLVTTLKRYPGDRVYSAEEDDKEVTMDYNNSVLKVKGQNCIVKVATNHGDVEVIGNNCEVNIGGNHGSNSLEGVDDAVTISKRYPGDRAYSFVGNNMKLIIDYNNSMRVKGNNCLVVVATNNGDIGVFGNNCKVVIGGNHGSIRLEGANGLLTIAIRYPGDRVILIGPGTHMENDGQKKSSECDTQLSPFTKNLNAIITCEFLKACFESL